MEHHTILNSFIYLLDFTEEKIFLDSTKSTLILSLFSQLNLYIPTYMTPSLVLAAASSTPALVFSAAATTPSLAMENPFFSASILTLRAVCPLTGSGPRLITGGWSCVCSDCQCGKCVCSPFESGMGTQCSDWDSLNKRSSQADGEKKA